MKEVNRLLIAVAVGVVVALGSLYDLSSFKSSETETEVNQAMLQADKQARIEEQVMLVQYDLMTDEMRMSGVVLGE